MSRCFPFPPPGYEKKTRTDDLDLLKKEKQREKKHKKEKRDKERKEGKEKREKDRSDEKQKEKREKKERQRDKKKDKEKTRDKDKNDHVTSDENNYLAQAEVEKRERNYEKSKEREKEKRIVSGEKVMGSTVYNGEVLGKNSHLPSENKNIKQLHRLSNKTTFEDGKRSNRLAETYLGMAIKKDVGNLRMGVTTPVTPMATSERSKERKFNDGRMQKHCPGVEGRSIVNGLVQNVVGMAQNRVEGVAAGQVEKNADRRIEVEERIRGLEWDGKKGEKWKDGDRGISMEKYKEKDKEKIKVERPKDLVGEMVVEQSIIKDSNRVLADLLRGKDGNKKVGVVAESVRPAKIGKEEKTAAAVSASPEISRKRKEFGSNQVLHEGDVGPDKMAKIMSSSPLSMTEKGRCSHDSSTVFAPVKHQGLSNAKQDEGDVGPNKMARITSSSHLPVTENGRSLHACHDSTTVAPIKQQALGKVKEYKDRRINGTSNSLKSAPNASQASATANQICRSVKKQPHPDTKYITQLLSVPKLEEPSDFDEQEWLFSRSLNKPKAELYGVDDTAPQVWAEPLRIESADVFALPYVIPR